MLRLWRCSHSEVRCIHGDEINARTPWWAKSCYRAACVTCGKALNQALPPVCTVTGAPHG